MKKGSFLFGSGLALATAILDLQMVASGQMVLGVFSLLGTLIVFSSAIVWLIYRDDGQIYLRRIPLAIPLFLLAAAMTFSLKQMPASSLLTPESLNETGNILMSRYQVGLWLVSAVIFFVFVISSSLMARRKT